MEGNEIVILKVFEMFCYKIGNIFDVLFYFKNYVKLIFYYNIDLGVWMWKYIILFFICKIIGSKNLCLFFFFIKYI